MNSIFENGIKSTENLGMKYSSYLDEKDFNEMILEGRTEDEYLEDYCMIIDYALLRGLEKSNVSFYTEKHHILPKCMSGENEDYNYVLLNFIEHVICHILLHKIYPTNEKLFNSAMIMINVKDRGELNNITKDKNYLKSLSKLKELSLQFRKRKIVCCNDNYDLLKIYSGVTDTTIDGFAYNTISSALNKKVGNYIDQCKGYFWNTLNDFIKLYPEKFNSFDNSINITITPKHNQERRIICLDNNYNIVKIYSGTSSVHLDGLNRSSVIHALLKSLNSYKGYYWCKYSEFNELDKIEDYYKLHVDDDNSIKLKEHHPFRIVQCDKYNNLLEIYENGADKRLLGYSSDCINECVNNKRRTYRGYYWFKFSDFKEKYPDKLEEYYKQQEQK